MLLEQEFKRAEDGTAPARPRKYYRRIQADRRTGRYLCPSRSGIINELPHLLPTAEAGKAFAKPERIIEENGKPCPVPQPSGRRTCPQAAISGTGELRGQADDATARLSGLLLDGEDLYPLYRIHS